MPRSQTDHVAGAIEAQPLHAIINRRHSVVTRMPCATCRSTGNRGSNAKMRRERKHCPAWSSNDSYERLVRALAPRSRSLLGRLLFDGFNHFFLHNKHRQTNKRDTGYWRSSMCRETEHRFGLLGITHTSHTPPPASASRWLALSLSFVSSIVR